MWVWTVFWGQKRDSKAPFYLLVLFLAPSVKHYPACHFPIFLLWSPSPQGLILNAPQILILLCINWEDWKEGRQSLGMETLKWQCYSMGTWCRMIWRSRLLHTGVIHIIAISSQTSSFLSGEEKHWGCWKGETKPSPKGVFRDAVVVLGMQSHTMQIVRDFLNESAAVWLPHPPFLSLSPIYPPSFCRKDISLPPLATPAHTPILYRRAPKCPAPSKRWSVSSGKRNSSTRNYITLEFGLPKTWRLEGRGLRVWQTLLGISRARKRAWPPRSTIHP